MWLAQVCSESEEPRSAFSPLSSAFLPHHTQHQTSASRRFLAAPYAGTGYLPTVIRPPPDYGQLPLLYAPPLATDKAASPASNTGSDKTSYSE
ncbi:hypothetical protein LSTR_LSTR016377 [Laodelphax striatellus]|uniref:Uncharacterized protein n=1 Tax=Laodelphax striatellus TaxID=195883 RepID=A0A482X904_LAOST|nr:hypothetical protein LSTR_LSTR016377 [Laodelphax striatellus]